MNLYYTYDIIYIYERIIYFVWIYDGPGIKRNNFCLQIANKNSPSQEFLKFGRLDHPVAEVKNTAAVMRFVIFLKQLIW